MFEQYGLEFEGTKRIYKINLTKREYCFENVEPYKITINGKSIKSSNWREFLFKVISYLIDYSGKTNEELFTIKSFWTRQDNFSPEMRTNYIKIKEGLYFNANSSTVHKIWFLQEFLQSCNVNEDNVAFWVRKYPISEPKEIKEYYIETTKKEFARYLKDSLRKAENNINIIIDKQFSHINSFLSKKFKLIENFFLMDDYDWFTIIKSKFLNEYKKEYGYMHPKNVAIVECALEYLKEFYREKKAETIVDALF